ncbi:MAG: YgiQ family radical SAM protein [Candidatus Omnitrophica bacterium]|nr:YgiQ family radical SAM protein [Candidatus Omnitrophota bacterium]
MSSFPFLPMFPGEVKLKGWTGIDVLLVTGDPYVDHPAYGAALIGRVLESRGYKVGIIAQPDWRTLTDFTRLGRPRLAACVTAGNVDSMIANYTAAKRPRRGNDSSTDTEKTELANRVASASRGRAGRPDRASIVYANRIRAAFKGLPVILGGLEASMRRMAHYDFWDNTVRRSILLDAKADMLVYGMAERAIVRAIDGLNQGKDIQDLTDIPGTVIALKKENLPDNAVFVPSFEETNRDFAAFNRAFRLTYENLSARQGKPVVQPQGNQYVAQYPPALPLSAAELDAVYALPYTRRWHPFYDADGGVKGFETVRWSITALRGCPGECNFCGLSLHQGRVAQSRSERSILAEAAKLAADPDFKGTISDVGGPTANLYGAHCRQWETGAACSRRQCLMPRLCPSLEVPYAKTLALYAAIRKIPAVKHLFIASGLRYDLLVGKDADLYLRRLCENYISGQMKVAPEHTQDRVLALMNKPSYDRYAEFAEKFERVNRGLKNRVYLVNYFICGHPGCGLRDAYDCSQTLLKRKTRPEQVQDFIPLPMTVSACMYHTGMHPFTGEKVDVEKGGEKRLMQRALLQSQNPGNQALIRKALRILGKANMLAVYRPWAVSAIRRRQITYNNPDKKICQRQRKILPRQPR